MSGGAEADAAAERLRRRARGAAATLEGFAVIARQSLGAVHLAPPSHGRTGAAVAAEAERIGLALAVLAEEIARDLREAADAK